jgi:hypothetical protein
VSLTNCTLAGSSAYNGGGIDTSIGTLTLTNCTLSGSSASNGGGIRNRGTLVLANCTLSNSSTTQGGGIYNTGTAALTNCTLTANSALYGGGLYNFGTAALTNCTLAANLASSGGGIRNLSTVNMLNTIVALNSGGNLTSSGVGTVNDLGHNLLSGNPLLGPLADYGGPTKTMAPLAGSPAIDAGDDSALAAIAAAQGVAAADTTDQRGIGFVRLFGPHLDIGAFELQPASTTTVATSQAVVLSGTTPTFTVTVADDVGLTAPSSGSVELFSSSTDLGAAVYQAGLSSSTTFVWTFTPAANQLPTGKAQDIHAVYTPGAAGFLSSTGTLAGGQSVVAALPGGTGTFTDSDGDLYLVKLTGPGQVGLLLNDPDADTRGPIDTLVVIGTDPGRSTMTVSLKKKVGDGLIPLGGVVGTGLKSLKAPASDLVGSGIQLTGLLGSLKIHDVLNGADIIAQGTPAQTTSLTAHVLGDGTTITLGSRLSSLKAARFGQGTLTAPSLGSLRITGDRVHGISGDFAASVILTGAGVAPGKPALAVAVIAGTVQGAIFSVQGNVGSFTVGAFLDSRLLVGFGVPSPGADPFTAGTGTFSGEFTLGSFTATSRTATAFVNSVVAAWTVTVVSLASAQTDNTANGHQHLGIIGHTVTQVIIQAPAFTWDSKHHVAAISDFLVKTV